MHLCARYWRFINEHKTKISDLLELTEAFETHRGPPFFFKLKPHFLFKSGIGNIGKFLNIWFL